MLFVSTCDGQVCVRSRPDRENRSLATSGPMPRKPTSDTRATPPATAAADTKRAPTVANLRTEIDRIDKDLVTLLNRRAEIALQIGQVKQKQGMEVWSSAREDEVIARALGTSRGPLPPETLRLIFREL